MGEVNFPEQTPLYHALHADRYARRDLIERVERITRRKLIVYFTNISHPQSAISKDDIETFQEMIYDCIKSKRKSIDLILQSGGGDIDSAEKIVTLIRRQIQSLRVIVTERAKSAATLIALASNEIVMSDTSELGPIDPQIVIPTPTGRMMYPAQSFLDGLRRIMDETQQAGALNPVYFPILSNLNPALIDFCVKAIERSKQFARNWLEQCMCHQNPNKAEQIASQLCDAQRYASHGAVIDWKEAKALGLKVRYVRPTDRFWEAVWRLHTAYEVFVRRQQIAKVYETSRVSIL
jgi:hypothetical protein